MQSAPTCLAVLGLASTVAMGGIVLMDQIGLDDGSSMDTVNGGLASQYFETAFSVYDIAAIDDFENPSSLQGASATKIFNGGTDIAAVQGAQVNFYSSPEAAGISLVGDVASQDYALLPAPDTNWSFTGTFSVTYDSGSAFWPLQSGTNYISIIPVNEFGVNSQTFTNGSTIGDINCWQANPNGGFGFGSLQNVTTTNVAYRVIGGSGNACDLPLPADCSADCSSSNGEPDGQVNVDDVLAVISGFGISGDGVNRPLGDVAPLPNGDCTVNVDDILAAIEQYGNDCSPRGACCEGVSGCTLDLKESECLDNGGEWLGEGSDCSTCTSGACCTDISDIPCYQATPEDCEASGGAYQGDDVPCGNCPALPENNSCNDAKVVTSGPVAFDNSAATTTGQPIEPCGEITESRQIYQDLWYSITAVESGTLTVSTCDATTLDTVIAVYSSCGGTVLGCNDDGVECSSFTSLLTIPNVNTGDSFIVRIGSFAYGATASFDALIEIAPEVEGACCLTNIDCIDLTPTDCTAFGGEYNVGECVTVSCGWGGCQGGDTDEGIPCSEDTDANGANSDPNGGLNVDPPSYGSILLNETICGSASTFLCQGCADDGTDLTYRDTDWYLFDNLEGGTYTITCGGEGPLLFGIVDIVNVSFVANSTTESGDEESLIVTLPAGNNYCVWVAHDTNAGFDTPCNTGQDQYTVRLEGEAAPAAACCLGTNCVGDQSPADCASLGGTYTAGESCDDNYICPTAYEPCNSGFAQDPLEPSGTWTAGTSDASIGYFRYESIDGVPSVTSARVYGITLIFTDAWTVCENPDMVFDVGTYIADASGFPAGAVVEATSLPGNQVTTDLTYAGVYPLKRFDLDINSPSADLLKVNSNSPNCWFLWMSSSDSTSGSSVLDNNGTLELSTFDLNYCITP